MLHFLIPAAARVAPLFTPVRPRNQVVQIVCALSDATMSDPLGQQDDQQYQVLIDEWTGRVLTHAQISLGFGA